eukprot:TRINITY_DN1036_c0_g1_i5.p1 TRINITY_DN1036_c0_g1~~TRINITY_DN1036_c0_g1_i5.p1  ORF type:complete len:218 (+),score=56.96 TRINITY_DN1036_c0_g1_i5:196-849(+)
MPSMKDIVIGARSDHKATVIFMHGLGDTGAGWEEPVMMLHNAMPNVKFILPTAPTMPVSLNQGMRMPAWYDIVGLGARSNEVCEGIDASAERISKLLKAERDAGVKKLFLCGFSQGGAMSLYTGLQEKESLTGIAALSGYLPRPSFIAGKTEAKKDIPILMCHGTNDMVVQLPWAEQSLEKLKEMGHKVEFERYPGMGHELDPREFQKFSSWLKSHI